MIRYTSNFSMTCVTDEDRLVFSSTGNM